MILSHPAPGSNLCFGYSKLNCSSNRSKGLITVLQSKSISLSCNCPCNSRDSATLTSGVGAFRGKSPCRMSDDSFLSDL